TTFNAPSADPDSTCSILPAGLGKTDTVFLPRPNSVTSTDFCATHKVTQLVLFPLSVSTNSKAEFSVKTRPHISKLPNIVESTIELISMYIESAGISVYPVSGIKGSRFGGKTKTTLSIFTSSAIESVASNVSGPRFFILNRITNVSPTYTVSLWLIGITDIPKSVSRCAGTEKLIKKANVANKKNFFIIVVFKMKQ